MDKGSYFGLKILHGLLKSFGRCPLVVTEDSNSSVSSVVGEDLRRNVIIT